MGKYLNLAVEMYFRGCTIRQSVAIAQDAINADSKNIMNILFRKWEE